MKILGIILGAILVAAVALVLIVGIPVLFGKVFLHWSKRRVQYIVSQTVSTVVSMVVVSLTVTGLGLFIGVVFHQEWAFSGGLLFVYTFWVAIKAVRNNIRNSRHM